MRIPRQAWAVWGLVLMVTGACGTESKTAGSRDNGTGWYGNTSSSSSSSGGGSVSRGGNAASNLDPSHPTRPPNVGPVQDAGAPPSACDGLVHDAVTLYQSADDSNSMASPVIARSLLRRGERVPANILRTYEFLNYYQVNYPPAVTEEVAVVPQLTQDTSGVFHLQVGLVAPGVETWQRRPVTLTLVLDTSGSMGYPSSGNTTPMTLLRAAVHAMAGALRAGDVVSMVTWNVDTRIPLSGHIVTGPNDVTLLAQIDALTASGGTDLEGGLAEGYALATTHYAKERLNRVVLISDGQANVGITSAQLIAQHSHTADEEGIYLVGIGVGDGVNDTLMDVVTDKGRGAYVYLDTVGEADAMLRGKFLQTMEVAARGVRLELTVPWYLRMQEFHGEQSSSVAANVDPQHLAPGQAMVYSETFAPCSPGAVSPEDLWTFKATWQSPLTHQPQEASVQLSVAALLGGGDAYLKKGNAIVAYAQALRDASGLLPWDAAAVFTAALVTVREANPMGADAALTEIEGLLIRAGATP